MAFHEMQVCETILTSINQFKIKWLEIYQYRISFMFCFQYNLNGDVIYKWNLFCLATFSISVINVHFTNKIYNNLSIDYGRR
jgi:hypothetical protein